MCEKCFCLKVPTLNSLFSCQRLALTPLCYLWQRDQAELLSEMIASGLEAVLIKVAGIGLKPNHLGKTLTEMQPTLTKLVSFWSYQVLHRIQSSFCRSIEPSLRFSHLR